MSRLAATIAATLMQQRPATTEAPPKERAMRLRGPLKYFFDFSSDAQFDPSLDKSYKSDYSTLIYHKVRYIHQQHINLCGDACINMLMAFHNRPYRMSLNNPRGVLDGTSSGILISQLQSAGLTPSLPRDRIGQTALTMNDLAKYLIVNGPVICASKVRYGVVSHWILLIGISESEIIYHDPWRGPNLRMSISAFNNWLDWEEVFSMIAVARRHGISTTTSPPTTANHFRPSGT
ncbi:papain-like cysteine protease family protein [Trinickia fusca]|uniref:Peptidase C39 domain-containing protein n=1 Tax=Trinickia fusca TaxID=2419777 RepID=A0A494XWM0_9BURK|nr:papain-like cysteine protease family protein [Trinickia fusca]RKP52504.1 hypothetical protein D7S89_03055 [Trinickia fusca]